MLGIALCTSSLLLILDSKFKAGVVDGRREMDLSAIKDALERVSKMQELSSSKTQEVIHQLEKQIEQALEKLQPIHNTISLINKKPALAELEGKLQELDPIKRIEGSLTELDVSLTEYGELLEKHFNSEISKPFKTVEFDLTTVNKIIAEHLYHQALFDIGDCFVNEAGVPEATALNAPFFELYQIMEAMRSENVEPALKFIEDHSDELSETELAKKGLDLKFKLHQLKFVEIIKEGRTEEGNNYATTKLAPLFSTHKYEFGELMAFQARQGMLDVSAYEDYLSPNNWDRVAREFCRFFGQSYESPLSLTLKAGFEALPKITDMISDMFGDMKEWESLKKLSSGLDLGPEFQIHSIFVCPVEGEETTKENPPLKLPCGHVFCKDCLKKIEEIRSPKWCYTCRTEFEVVDYARVYF